MIKLLLKYDKSKPLSRTGFIIQNVGNSVDVKVADSNLVDTICGASENL